MISRGSLKTDRSAGLGRGVRLLVAVAGLLAAAAVARVHAGADRAEADKTVQAVVITVHEMIDDGLFQSIKRRSEEAMEGGADYLIYEIETYGGLVQSADDISKYLIQDIPDEVRTVAYVNREAISAGAMISVACRDILMRRGTTIGASAPITMGGELEGAEREKMESFIRATFSRAAEANGYPEALLRAMVSRDLEVWQVPNRRTGGNEYFEKAYLPDDPNTYDLNRKKLVVPEGELLTLTAAKAKEYGIARAVVDNLDEALAFLEQRDGVVFARPVGRLETNWSEEMVRFLNSPTVVSILILGILLGIYVEFNTPGLGLPGLTAVICLAILVGSKYLIGMANWWEIAILALGVVLLMVEIFVIPGFGIAGFMGIALILVGLFALFIPNAPDEIPWPKDPTSWDLAAQNLFAVAVGFLIFVVIAILISRYMDRLPFLQSMILRTSVGRQPAEVALPPEQQAKTADLLKVGQIGKAVSILRPAGKARFGDEMADVITRGEFIEEGIEVEITEIQGNRIVVERKRMET